MGSETMLTTDGETDESDGSESSEIIPKVEAVEHEPIGGLSEIKRSEEPESSEEKSDLLAKKRGRGRPRKVQPSPTPSPNKVAKGRSKTGCLTCRRRKKKCDEGKPSCKIATTLKMPVYY